MKNLAKYLEKYAENEILSLNKISWHCSYKHIVVIPAYKENADFICSFINSELVLQQVLIIVVINQPVSDTDITPQQALQQDIHHLGTKIFQQGCCSLVQFPGDNSACLLVDRFNCPIENDLGVGLARKIGVDIACQLIHQQVVASRWIHSTDADAVLPNNYFTALTDELMHQKKTLTKSNAVVACYNFTHKSLNKEVESANALYEKALRYYVAGLSYARSHYCFFTIGSTLAFSAEAYVSVRGFPKKSAGEDFYLINKLAKLGQVLWLNDCVLTLEARPSDRVPFGTGPAVIKIIDQKQHGESYFYYHPHVFTQLKCVISAFDNLYQYRNDIKNWPLLQSEQLQKTLLALGFDAFIQKQSTHSKIQFDKQVITWFDSFKTLKFIHYLRDNYLPNIPLVDAIELAEFDLE